MSKFSFGDIRWQIAPRVGLAILIMIAVTAMWRLASVQAAGPCDTPTVITGGGSFAVSTSATCFKYVNTTFKWGGMWTVMNGSTTAANTLNWYGGMSETVNSCVSNSQALSGNGAQLNNFTVAKDSTGAMYLTITANAANTVSISIQNWQNGTGCSVAPTPVVAGPSNTPAPATSTRIPDPTLTAMLPTATRSNTPLGPTATRTNTSVLPTATRTNMPIFTPSPTPVGSTATRTPTPTVGASNTSIVPTATRTNTPIGPTNTPVSGSLVVQINKGNGIDNTQETGFNFLLKNTGPSAVSNLSTRLYFDTDGSNTSSGYVLEKYYDQSGVATYSGPTLACGSTYYFTVTYGTASLPAGGQWEIQTALHLSSWASTYSGANDFYHSGYAVGALPVSYTTTANIPAYISGALTSGSTPSCGPTNTPSPATATRTNTPIPPTATRTNTPGGPTATNTPIGPTPTQGASNIGNATWFDSLGMPYGGCGITQSALDTQNFIALNVQNSPGDYTTFHPRPIAPEFANVIGAWNNGLNCGRWVKVTISDYCNGTNDGAQNQPFCRGGLGYVADAYNGATLDMIVADSCYDSNAWCRDDPYHIDLAHASLNTFIKNGAPVGDMDPLHWNNRHVQWQYETAPGYTGDIKIGFIESAQLSWTPIAITHLLNGIHAVDYFNGTSWVKATMDADMGQTYLIGPTVSGTGNYQIRVYDVNDQLINNGRIYNFSFPSGCGSQCSTPYTGVTYTTQ